MGTNKQGWWRRRHDQFKNYWQNRPSYPMFIIPSAEGRRDATGVTPTPEQYAEQSAELRAAINSRREAREED